MDIGTAMLINNKRKVVEGLTELGYTVETGIPIHHMLDRLYLSVTLETSSGKIYNTLISEDYFKSSEHDIVKMVIIDINHLIKREDEKSNIKNINVGDIYRRKFYRGTEFKNNYEEVLSVSDTHVYIRNYRTGHKYNEILSTFLNSFELVPRR